MENFNSEELQIEKLTREYVSDLISIWKRIFDKSMCKENLGKLVNHATQFYEDLVSESLEKELCIKKDISELQNEILNVRQILSLDTAIKFPTNKPLLVCQNELENHLSGLRETLQERSVEIHKLLSEQNVLCDELDVQPYTLTLNPLPTSEEVSNFEMYLAKLRTEKESRMRQVLTLRSKIKDCLRALEIILSSEHEEMLISHNKIKLSNETLSALNEIYQKYVEQVKHLAEKIDEMKTKLQALWNRLGTSPSSKRSIQKYTDYSQTTYDVLHREIARCESLKSQNIREYVEKVRKEILAWWDKSLKSTNERNRFSNFNNNCYTDDLLLLHEMELDDLKSFYFRNKQIFEMYHEWKDLVDKMVALESKTSEPGRYKNRCGQLLKEEKERKIISLKLPKIETQLKELVKYFEDRENTQFLIYGENILDIVARDGIQKQKDKTKISSVRNMTQGIFHSGTSLTPITPRTQPLFQRTPLSTRPLRNPMTISAKKIPASESKLSERKMCMPPSRTPIAKRNILAPKIAMRTPLTPVSTNKNPLKLAMKSRNSKSATVLRRSGRICNNIKRRFSINNLRKSLAKQFPDFESDETYDDFQQRIEPASRSSVIQNPSSFFMKL